MAPQNACKKSGMSFALLVFVVLCVGATASETCSAAQCDAESIVNGPPPTALTADIASTTNSAYFFFTLGATTAQAGLYSVTGPATASYRLFQALLYARLDSNPFCVLISGNQAASVDFDAGNVLGPLLQTTFNISITKSFPANTPICARVIVSGGTALNTRLILGRADCAGNTDCGARCLDTGYLEGFCSSSGQCGYANRNQSMCPQPTPAPTAAPAAATAMFSSTGYVVLGFSLAGALLLGIAVTSITCLVRSQKRQQRHSMSSIPMTTTA